MPIRVDKKLPAREMLEYENIFVMDQDRAIHQDIRPLNVGILNLMPIKQDTELQLLRAVQQRPLSAFPHNKKSQQPLRRLKLHTAKVV